jgi:hypothetical protein
MQPNLRRCIVCRKLAPKQDFYRVVRVHPTHEVVLDEGMGRSAYLCREESCIVATHKKNRLGKALKASIPDVIYRELTCRCAKNYFAKNELKR